MGVLPLRPLCLGNMAAGAKLRGKKRRSIHRLVTLHGDTAGSRGFCSLLLDASRSIITRIYGLIDAVFL